jgi:hypothetical protein
MNTPPDTPDPFLKCLTDEAANLSGLAASEARRYRSRRARYRRQLARGLAIAILGVSCWQALPLLRPIRKEAGLPPKIVRQPPAPAVSRPAEFVKVQTLQEAMSEPVTIPPGASQEQKALLEAARGLPLLLVMDDSGKLARIHVVER